MRSTLTPRSSCGRPSTLCAPIPVSQILCTALAYPGEIRASCAVVSSSSTIRRKHECMRLADDFRMVRQNEAAQVADAVAWVRSAVSGSPVREIVGLAYKFQVDERR